MITDFEQIDHAKSHIHAAARHIENAKEHLAGWTDHSEKVEKMAGAHLSKSAQEIGSAVAQHAMAKKHIDSLIGREGYDGNETFDVVKHASGAMGNHLKQAGEHHAALSDAAAGDNAAIAVKRHQDLSEHLSSAHAHASDAENAISKLCQAKAGDAEKLHGSLHFTKRLDGTTGDEFRLFVPISKVEEVGDGTIIVEAWANVADFIDSDGEYFSPAGLRKFVESWAPFGNFRAQHDPKKPAGTIRQPVLGKKLDCELGWWIKTHPETKTDGLFVRSHAIDPETVDRIVKGVYTGLSVGGRIPAGGRTNVQVEINDKGVVLREISEAA